MMFEVTVVHTKVERYLIEAESAVEAVTAWRERQPVKTEGPHVSDVEVRMVRDVRDER